MKKALFAVISAVMFASCSFWNEPVEEFFSYWSSEAFVTDSSVKVPNKSDKSGIVSVSSDADAEVILNLSNPKSFRFVMPAVGNSEMIRFGGLETQPVPGTDYTLEQISGDKLKLTYKTAFLKQHEWGNGDLGATLTLYADDGRKFKKPYAFSIKSNTRPPKPKIAVAKTKKTPAHYVLCLTVPDMDKHIAGGLIHKDITSITIGTEKYDFSLNDKQTAFVKPANDFIDSGDTEQLSEPDADTVPSGWTLYYKTDVEVKDGAAKKDYTIKLIDKEGLVSETLYASTKPNKAEAPACEIIRGKKNDALSGNGTEKSTAFVIAAATEEPVVQIKLQSATSAVDVNCTVKEDGSTTSVQYKGNPVTVPLNLNGKDEKLYKVEYYADGTGYKTTDTQTVYFKVLRQHTVTFDANGGAYSDGSTTVSKTALHGTVVAAPNPLPQKQDFGVSAWYKEASCTTQWNFATNPVTGDMTLYAKWTPNICNVEVYVVGGGKIEATPEGGTETSIYENGSVSVEHGKKVTFTAVPDPGWEFEKWMHNDSEVPGHTSLTYELTNVTSSITSVTVKFKKTVYTVNYSVDGGHGNIKADSGNLTTGGTVSVEHGGSVTFTAVPDSGYAVDSWSTNVNVGTSDKRTATLSHVTADTVKTVTVKFKKVYTVTFKVVDGEGGMLKGSYGGHTKIATGGNIEEFTNVPAGTQVSFEATPDPGWKVEDWTLDGTNLGSIQENYGSTITADITVTVKFERVTTIQHGNNFAWKLLKNAVKVAVDGAVITIKGEIKASGHYEGDWGEIVIDKTLTIKGETGAGTDILDASSMSRIFKVESGKTLTLEKLTLKGGNAKGEQDADNYGGAIYASGATVNITNCTFKGNEAALGGGAIYAREEGSTASTITISGGTIGGDTDEDKNKVTSKWQFGGGILVVTGCTLTLDSVQIIGNEAWRAGGVRANLSTVNMTNCTIKNNKTTGNNDSGGGGIYTFMGTLTMTGCTIAGNEAATNGGGLNVEGTTTNITNCTFTGNTAKNGGGIYTKKVEGTPPTVTISGGTIGGTGSTDANKAAGTGPEEGNGGGIYVGEDCKVTLQNNGSTGCTIAGNTAQCGGGVYVKGGTFKMSGSAVVTPSTGLEANIKGKNDVYLKAGQAITVNGSLSHAHAARITPQSYTATTVLQAGSGVTLANEVGKFAVTQPNSSTLWYIDSSNGALKAAATATAADGNQLRDAIQSAQVGKPLVITITQDFSTTESFKIPNGKNITIKDDGTSRTLDCPHKGDKHKFFLVEDGGKLTLQGKITLQGADNGNDEQYALYVEDGGTAEIKDNVTITGFKNNGDGCVYTNGTLIMSGGIITGNRARFGGGVYIFNNGIFEMTGGSIERNSVVSDGSAMRIRGIFNWWGGTIQNNTIDNPGANPKVLLIDSNSNGQINNTSGNMAS